MRRIKLGRFGRAHGIRGEVVVHSYTAVPDGVAGYGPLSDEAGRQFVLHVVRSGEKGVICRVEGVRDRTAAEQLTGIELWIDRERLPPPGDGEYYHEDLTGLEVVDEQGRRVGRIVSVQNFGAGDLLEIVRDGRRTTELVPFRDPFVGAIDLKAGRIEVLMPEPDGADA